MERKKRIFRQIKLEKLAEVNQDLNKVDFSKEAKNGCVVFKLGSNLIMEKEPKNCFEKFRTHIERYTDVRDVEMDDIRGFFTVKEVKKKNLLLVPGQICGYEYFIVSGLFQSAIPDEFGKIHTLNFPHEEWWVGDYKSFTSRQPSTMRIEALEDAMLLGISKNSLDELLASSKSFSTYFRILSENASIAANDRIINQLSQSAEERYKLFCRKYPGIIDRLSQRRVASFLGISPEYFNQIERKFKRVT